MPQLVSHRADIARSIVTGGHAVAQGIGHHRLPVELVVAEAGRVAQRVGLRLQQAIGPGVGGHVVERVPGRQEVAGCGIVGVRTS